MQESYLSQKTERASFGAPKTEHASFGAPSEVGQFPDGRVQLVSIGGAEVGRLVLGPGWLWSNDVKPIAGTDSREAPHFQCQVSGRLAIRMDVGTELVAEPGDVTSLPSGKAWVVRDEPPWWWTGTALPTTPTPTESTRS
ncbi:MAG: cupin domain-containing protein [Solirubrobacteraceae bacterium]